MRRSKGNKRALVRVRRGNRHDSAKFLRLVALFAKAIHLKPPDTAANRRLIHDIFSTKRVHLLVATAGTTLVGYALYFYAYSSFAGRSCLFVEDLFVLSEYRDLGVGRLLLMKCAKDALRHDCDSMKWEVLLWNKGAMAFFRKLGAQRLGLYSYQLFLDKLK